MEKVKLKLDWHWREPLWPIKLLGTDQAAEIAEFGTRRECRYCGFYCLGDTDGVVIRNHIRMRHPGQTEQYFIFPPAFGIKPKGVG